MKVTFISVWFIFHPLCSPSLLSWSRFQRKINRNRSKSQQNENLLKNLHMPEVHKLISFPIVGTSVPSGTNFLFIVMYVHIFEAYKQTS